MTNKNHNDTPQLDYTFIRETDYGLKAVKEAVELFAGTVPVHNRIGLIKLVRSAFNDGKYAQNGDLLNRLDDMEEENAHLRAKLSAAEDYKGAIMRLEQERDALLRVITHLASKV